MAMTEQEKRQHRCCFTGHRPEKLQCSEAAYKMALEGEISRAVDDGFCTFISGVAWGVDIVAVEIVLQYRAANPALHLICAVPHPGFEKRMSESWRKRYLAVLENADIVRTISQMQSRSCYQTRNIWMVDRSARVIAIYNGKPGGTRNTIEYAKQAGVETVIIDLRFLPQQK